MVDRNIGLTGEQPHKAASKPALSKAGPDCESSIDQADSGIDLFTKVAERIGYSSEDVRVVRGYSKRAPRQIEARSAVRLPVLGPAVEIELGAAVGCQRKGRTVIRIALDRPPEQVERLNEPVFLEGTVMWQ